MPLTIQVWKGKRALREKVPTALNDVIDFPLKKISNLQHKCNTVSLQVQTAQFGIGDNEKQAGTSLRKKIAQTIDHDENNPLSGIVTLFTIYWEVPCGTDHSVGSLYSHAQRSRKSTIPSSSPAVKVSSSSKRISTRRSALQMKVPMNSRLRN